MLALSLSLALSPGHTNVVVVLRYAALVLPASLQESINWPSQQQGDVRYVEALHPPVPPHPPVKDRTSISAAEDVSSMQHVCGVDKDWSGTHGHLQMSSPVSPTFSALFSLFRLFATSSSDPIQPGCRHAATQAAATVLPAIGAGGASSINTARLVYIER